MTTAEVLANLPTLHCYLRRWRGTYVATCLQLGLHVCRQTATAAKDDLWYPVAMHLWHSTFLRVPTVAVPWWRWLEYYALAVIGWLTKRSLTWKIRNAHAAEEDVVWSGWTESQLFFNVVDDYSQDGFCFHRDRTTNRVIGVTVRRLAKEES